MVFPPILPIPLGGRGGILPTALGSKVKGCGAVDNEVAKVFDYWIEHHTSRRGRRPVLSADREKRIRAAIASHGVDTTLRAIYGCTLSGWHMGDNPNGQKYNDISLILRNAGKIESFAALADGESANTNPRDVQLSSYKHPINVPLSSNNDNFPEMQTTTESDDWVAALVDRVFATWNIEPNKPRRKAAIEAWSPILQDLSPDDCFRAVEELAVLATGWMPRPGEIRRHVLRSRLDAPLPLQAWLQFQMALKAVHSGAEAPVLHRCVFTTVNMLGGGAGLHTNGDRELFIEIYRTVVAEYEAEILNGTR